MTVQRFHRRLALCGLALPAALATLSAQAGTLGALLTSAPVTLATTVEQPLTAYNGPVMPTPAGCDAQPRLTRPQATPPVNMARLSLAGPTGTPIITPTNDPDTLPRSRPSLVVTSPMAAATAQVVLAPDLAPGTRRVAYTYSFNTLNLTIPATEIGMFSPTSVRVVVHAGATAAAPVASDQTRTGGNAIAYANTALEQLVSGNTAFAGQWLVKVVTSGFWQTGAHAPWTPAQVAFDCRMTIQPAGRAVIAQPPKTAF